RSRPFGKDNCGRQRIKAKRCHRSFRSVIRGTSIGSLPPLPWVILTIAAICVQIKSDLNQPLLQALFDEEERRPLTVSELTEQVRSEIERRFANVWVEGEIVNFMAARSGHWYFTLHDDTTQIKAVC